MISKILSRAVEVIQTVPPQQCTHVVGVKMVDQLALYAHPSKMATEMHMIRTYQDLAHAVDTAYLAPNWLAMQRARQGLD